jgi:hypothetical protein
VSSPDARSQFHRDLAESFEGDSQVFDDFLDENVHVRCTELFRVSVSEPRDVEAGLVAKTGVISFSLPRFT